MQTHGTHGALNHAHMQSTNTEGGQQWVGRADGAVLALTVSWQGQCHWTIVPTPQIWHKAAHAFVVGGMPILERSCKAQRCSERLEAPRIVIKPVFPLPYCPLEISDKHKSHVRHRQKCHQLFLQCQTPSWEPVSELSPSWRGGATFLQ